MIMRIQDIPTLDRPREKALRYGTETLTDAELLAILINTGHKDHNALDIANELLYSSRGLYGLCSLNQKDLKAIKGINKVRSIQLLTLFTIMDRIKRKKADNKKGPVDSNRIYEKYTSRSITPSAS